MAAAGVTRGGDGVRRPGRARGARGVVVGQAGAEPGVRGRGPACASGARRAGMMPTASGRGSSRRDANRWHRCTADRPAFAIAGVIRTRPALPTPLVLRTPLKLDWRQDTPSAVMTVGSITDRDEGSATPPVSQLMPTVGISSVHLASRWSDGPCCTTAIAAVDADGWHQQERALRLPDLASTARRMDAPGGPR